MYSASNSPKLLLLCSFIAGIIFRSIFFSSSASSSSSSSSAAWNHQQNIPAYVSHLSPSDSRENDVHNRTLGFQKVFAINLPERVDKRDALAVASTLTGFDIEIVPGVRGDNMSRKAVPSGWNVAEWDGATLGTWRSHLDVAQRMIREQIQSAFILEDDADWDVSLRHQLPEIAKGLRQVMGSSGPSQSPWGEDWDMLWIGHCGAGNKPEKNKESEPYYIINNDPTVPGKPGNRRGHDPNHSAPGIQYTNTTRMIFRLDSARCLFGYALSLRGAYQILAKQSLDQAAHPIDRAYSRMCSGRSLACFTVWPPVFGSLKPAGDPTKGSDRQEAKGPIRTKPETLNIKFPILHNYWSLILNEKKIKSQFPDEDDYLELDLETFKYPEGRVENLDASQFTLKTQ